MAKDFQLIRLTVDEGRLKGASNRSANAAAIITARWIKTDARGPAYRVSTWA
jgi:hypothetical protein